MILPMQRGISEIALSLIIIIIATATCRSKQVESLLIGRYIVGRSDDVACSRLVLAARPVQQLWFSNTNNLDDNIPINTESEVLLGNKLRKKRRNKYENFSRVNIDIDPLETLIEESKRMNQDLLIDIKESSSTRRPKMDVSVEITSTPTKMFPDVKGIDPYDPETFGYLMIGTIIGAHGVHGWLKVQCTTDFPVDRLCTAGIRHLKAANKRAPREVVLLNGKHRLGDEYLIQLDQINDRDTAQKLRGSILYIREEQKSYELNEDEYVVSDLVGLDVYLKVDQDDTNREMYVGIVGGVVFSDDICSIPGLGHDYLEIVLPRGIGGTLSYRDEMVLIPMVPQIVPEVDITGRRIMIDPPTGLLDLRYIRDEKTRIKGFLPPAKSS